MDATFYSLIKRRSVENETKTSVLSVPYYLNLVAIPEDIYSLIIGLATVDSSNNNRKI